MSFNKAQKRKLSRLIDSIFNQCPGIHSIEVLDFNCRVNGVRMSGTMDPWLYINFTKDSLNSPEIKAWLIEHDFKAEEMYLFCELFQLYIPGNGYGDFSFKKKGSLKPP